MNMCWSKLPVDLLEMIDEYVMLYVDKIRFRCVCTYWLSELSQLPNLRQSQQPPWLLLPYNSINSGSLCALYHPFENKVYEIDLPEAGEKVFRGSDFGWVVTLLENGSIYVVNPLSRARRELPPRYTFPDVLEYCPDRRGAEYLLPYVGGDPDYIDAEHVRNYMVPKIALSCCPTPNNDFYAVAIYWAERSVLAYCKSGDSKWDDLLDFDYPNHRRGYEDIIFLHGKLYALACSGELMICDDLVSCPKFRLLVPPPNFKYFSRAYNVLANSSFHGLLVIHRVPKYDKQKGYVEEKHEYQTVDFKIFKLDMAHRRWRKLKSLGNEILFTGLGSQVCDSSENLRASKGNQIYFASSMYNVVADDVENIFDNGILNFRNKRIDPLGYICSRQVIWPLPIWVMPNPF